MKKLINAIASKIAAIKASNREMLKSGNYVTLSGNF